MSKKTPILIIFTLIILIIGGLVFFYFSSNNTKKNITDTITKANPFGNTSGNKTFATSTKKIPEENNQFANTTENLAKLIQLYKNPISGAVFFVNKNKQNVLRFTDRAVGNIYEYMPETQTGEVQRLTNTTIPKIQETVWSNLGDNLILRYLDENTDNIISFSTKIKNNSTSSPQENSTSSPQENYSSPIDSFQELTGFFLSPNLKSLVINPKGDKIFGLIDKSDKSGTYGFTTKLDGSGKKTIFESSISYWNISWPKENIIALTTKPNYKDTGLLYFFNTQTYSMDRILGNMVGLSTITNKEANLVAYSYSENNSFLLDIYDVVNKISENLKIPTLADKCVWGNKNAKILYCAIPKNIYPNNYPDVWYQGLISFKESIWKIDTETGAIEELYQTVDENIGLDMFDLKISQDDEYLAFSDKNDLSLWLLKITDQ